MLLLLGILLGFWLAAMTHVVLASLWLLITYGLIVIVYGTQFAVMIPWYLRAQAAAAGEEAASAQAATLAQWIFTIAYIAFISLMILRPQ